GEIRALIDVEQRALRAFEEQRLSALARGLQQRGDVGHHRLELCCERQGVVACLRERYGLAVEIPGEDEVVEFEHRLRAPRQTPGVEEGTNTKPSAAKR